MKLYHLSSGSIGHLHFKAGKDDRDWQEADARTLIGAGASRPAATAPPPPTPAPSGRELRHALAKAMREDEIAERREAGELPIAGVGADDEPAAAVDKQPPSSGHPLVPGSKVAPPKPDKSTGPRAAARKG